MKVLHDWDYVRYSLKRAGHRIFQLGLFVLSKWVTPLQKLSIVKAVYNDLYRNAIAMAKLDHLLKIHSVFGLRDEVVNLYPDISDELEKLGAEVRRHIHIGGPNDAHRERLWEPPLTQRIETWRYDKHFINGRKEIEKLLEKGELPIFHVDYPEFLSVYVDWLYWVIVEGGKIYKDDNDA